MHGIMLGFLKKSSEDQTQFLILQGQHIMDGLFPDLRHFPLLLQSLLKNFKDKKILHEISGCFLRYSDLGILGSYSLMRTWVGGCWREPCCGVIGQDPSTLLPGFCLTLLKSFLPLL